MTAQELINHHSVLYLSSEYYSVTKDTTPFNTKWLQAVDTILDTMTYVLLCYALNLVTLRITGITERSNWTLQRRAQTQSISFSEWYMCFCLQ